MSEANDPKPGETFLRGETIQLDEFLKRRGIGTSPATPPPPCGKPIGPNPMGDDDTPCTFDAGHDGGCGVDGDLEIDRLNVQIENERGARLLIAEAADKVIAGLRAELAAARDGRDAARDLVRRLLGALVAATAGNLSPSERDILAEVDKMREGK